VRTVLNGQEMQISNTKNMVFGVTKLISYISEGTTLMPGDLIPTGTPFGVGFSRKPPVYLRDGDESRVRGGKRIRIPSGTASSCAS
jgi:2-keto-4-pentenoate hydratase/2-oxohepta-3-ene-1,7-dioic acid hydratase in catechol pathway